MTRFITASSYHVSGAPHLCSVVARSLQGLTITTTLLTTCELGAQPARLRVRDAAVSITVQPGGRATVQARYEFMGNPGAMSFEFLKQPCAPVGEVQVTSNGLAVAHAREDNGPWVRLHDTSAVDPSRSSLGYTVTYDVELYARESNIPVLLPMAVLTGRRRGDAIVRLDVQLPAGSRVTLPRMSRGAQDGQWSARMAAIPSVVRVRSSAPNDTCGAITAPPEASGNFVPIFWSLVAVLALWVPTYLWWANRKQQTA